MKIKTYSFKDVSKLGWKFDKVEFQKINLIVGDSGMGKTRLLNTMFNLASAIALGKLKSGIWEIGFYAGNSEYIYDCEIDNDEENKTFVAREKLQNVTAGKERELVKRDRRKMFFKGEKMPKLSRQETAIALFKDDKDIEKVFEGFGKFVRRRFFGDELQNASAIPLLDINLVSRLEKLSSIEELSAIAHAVGGGKINLNVMLYGLSRHFKDIYNSIVSYYREVFPFIEQIAVRPIQEVERDIEVQLPGSKVPVVSIKEKKVDKWIILPELSSGMQKVLLILTDLMFMGSDSIYFIDEYENSLGINAINFFPDFLVEEDPDVQMFITSHHPYIINKLPISSWYVMSRKGSHVSIHYGKELVERYSKSKQEAFIQLINDPIYVGSED